MNINNATHKQTNQLHVNSKNVTIGNRVLTDTGPRDNKTMNRSGGFLRFWIGESNPATRLS